MRTGELFSEEYRLTSAEGLCWVMAEGRCQMADDGTPLRFPGVSFDITDRKIAEEKLRQLYCDLEAKVTERALERGRTWQVSPEVIGVLNSDGYFESSNPAWKTTLGWSEEEIARTVFFDFIHPDDLPKTRDAWDDAIERGLPALRFENRYRHKNGSYRWLSWVAVPDDGKIYCSARDITDEKEQANALAVAEDSLRQSQKMEAVGQLTGGLAHDFNNLLTGIGGSLEIMQTRIAQGRSDEIDRYMAAAQGAVRRAASLTHRLLAFSRRQTLDPKATDVNQLIADMEELVRRTVGPAIEVKVVDAVGVWPILIDSNQLENALLNLCINARDAMPDGGKLTIESANKWLDGQVAAQLDLPPGHYVSLCVTDTGSGMSPEVIARAFEPFFTTKAIGAGTGLGLSMIYGFLRQSGGHVRIYSELEKGTTMCLYLPRHHSAAAPRNDEHRIKIPRCTVNGQSVLIIDDEDTIRMLIGEALREAGYTVHEASDGHSGLRILRSDVRVDLLITDVGLPGGLDGGEVADAARHLRPELTVLFITGYAENAAFSHGHVEHGMPVMTKPFTIDALARKVGELMEH
jgi:PAS domain S-box-containing protein